MGPIMLVGGIAVVAALAQVITVALGVDPRTEEGPVTDEFTVDCEVYLRSKRCGRAAAEHFCWAPTTDTEAWRLARVCDRCRPHVLREHAPPTLRHVVTMECAMEGAGFSPSQNRCIYGLGDPALVEPMYRPAELVGAGVTPAPAGMPHPSTFPPEPT